MKRALRRYHQKRMKEKAKKELFWLDEDIAVKCSNHMKTCSCPICGNLRKYGKGQERFSIQERKYKFNE